MLQKEKDKMKAKFISFESAPVPKKSEVPSTPASHSSLKRAGNSSLDDDEGSMNKKAKASQNLDEYGESSVSNMAGKKASEWKSFWVPELGTSAEPDRIEKPVSIIFKLIIFL